MENEQARKLYVELDVLNREFKSWLILSNKLVDIIFCCVNSYNITNAYKCA